jgi:Fe-S cluster assembly iron-binding protein IscA
VFRFTPDAATLIRSLVDDAKLGDGAGLRMSIDPARRSLSMKLAEAPDASDKVYRHRDVRIFLEPAAAARLHARTLDAQHDGRRAFFLRDR